MNCDNAHKQIHLFSELTAQGREGVMTHVRECKQCAELFEEVQLMQSTLQRAASVVVEPTDSFKLTNRIMERVRVPNQSNFVDLALSYFESKALKWALATISISLISIWSSCARVSVYRKLIIPCKTHPLF